jgi:cyclopropane fatty-acyl-phospholipid synthase-like methyltransferase
METSIPQRIAAAVELLAVQPHDHVLEIGCGNGAAAALVCERVGDGRLDAIDRSETQIRLARKRNHACVKSGKATFQVMALESATLDDAQFDKIFAINVNAFWLRYEKPLAAVKRLLKPHGAFFIFYQQPTTAKMRDVSKVLHDNLANAGLVVTWESSDRVYCLESTLPKRRTQ